MKFAGERKSRYDIVPTHGAGTVLVRNRLMIGRDGQLNLFRPSADEFSPQANKSGETGDAEPINDFGQSLDTSSQRVTPLACVSLFEHAYIADYGVNGREQYVRDWLKYVDWESIAKFDS